MVVLPPADHPPEMAAARAETMLTIAEVTGIDVEALAFLARRFYLRLGTIAAAEPAGRRELENLIAADVAELATA